jgi:hypothetical protein
MAERFTTASLLMSACIRDLINYYYMEKNHLPGDPWPSEKIKNALLGLFNRLYDDCGYSQDDQWVGFSYSGSRSGESAFTCYVDTKERSSFITIMDKLVEAIREKDFAHFVVLKISDEVMTVLDEETEVICFTPPQGLTRKMALSAMKQGKTLTHKLDRYNTLAFIPRQSVWVDCVSPFGKYLLNLGEWEEGGFACVQALGFHELDFIPLVRALLINFHLEFNGFERIKSCSQCGKIYFEKKKGARLFCSSSCRKEHHHAQEPAEKRKCRDKQNHWIDYKLNNDARILSADRRSRIRLRAYTVSKSDCSACDNPQAGGECGILKERNENVFEIMQ